jgi:hypothetical protein
VEHSASPSPYFDLTAVLRAMRAAVGGWGGQRFLAAALTVLLFGRLGQICRDFERLSQRFQDGRLRRILGRAGRGSGVRDGAPIAWPCRFGWLLRAAKHHAAVYSAQVRAVLETPEMVALLIAAPQARRLLRPVCRMLAIEPALLRPRATGDVVPEIVARVVTKRVRTKPAPIDWGRIPLPRGVLSAARRQGFGKVPRD